MRSPGAEWNKMTHWHRLTPRLVVVAAVCGALDSSIQAQGNPAKFLSVLELSQSGVGPSVAGGRLAPSSEYQASFFYALSKDDHCSATVIGARVLVTAAHCVKDLPGQRMELALANDTFKGECVMSPHYSPSNNSYNFGALNAPDAKNTSADFALCLLDKRVPNIRYESVARLQLGDKVGEQLLVTGYGCAGFAGIARADYRFRVGDTFVNHIPNTNSYYIVADGSAAVCPGDSGGATYREFGSGARVLAGINSRTNQVSTSYISSLTSSAAEAFFAQWEQKHPASICGRGSTDASCS